MNIFKKLFARKSIPDQSGEADPGYSSGDKRVCAGCSRTFVTNPIEVEDVGIAVRKRYQCPHCGASMNFYDRP